MERIPLYQKKYLQLQRQIASRIEELKQQLDNLGNAEKRACLLQIEEEQGKLNKLETLLTLNLDDSINAIAYLAILVEENIYEVETINTLLHDQEKHTDQPALYNIFYLVERNQKNDNLIEIWRQFPFSNLNEREYTRRNICLETPNEHYIQIAYKKYTDRNPSISYYIGQIEQNGKQKAKICDPRYAYILDYIDTLILDQLEKRRWITSEEMIKIAMDFASLKEKSKVKI